ncbi:MAG: CvpA family protein [Bacteroidales bacterium]|jgi:membrane protein required for colicin V production|nr:CvpA family protein [Bacteroidales bacterium]
MTLLDFIVLLPVVWLCIRGFIKGLIIELATLAGMALGILAAYYFAADLQALMQDYFSLSENGTRIVAYILIFLVVLLIVWIIGKLVEKSVDLMAMGWLNKLLGAIVGIIKGVVIVCVALYLVEKYDTRQKVIKPEVKEKSMFYQPIMEAVHLIAATPGSSLPSMYSSMAPPPVLT